MVKLSITMIMRISGFAPSAPIVWLALPTMVIAMKNQKVYRLLPMVLILAFFFICITGPAAADQESDDAKVLRQFGEEIVKNNPSLASASNLEKAKAGFVEYLKKLSASNAGVSNDVWGRINDKLFADERTAFTCSVHTLNLQDIFKGMGINSESIGQIGGEMDTYNPLNVNSDHGAVLIRDNDGKEYVFDAWAHATMRDTMSPLDDLYGEGETSPFNGMPKSEWTDQMRAEGYTTFFEDGFLADPTDNTNKGDSKSTSLSGSWSTDWGGLEMIQNGDTVTGTYTHDSGKINGVLSGNTLSGTWSEAPTYSGDHDSGKFVWIISPDFKSFTGTWGYGSSSEGGGWVGTKT